MRRVAEGLWNDRKERPAFLRYCFSRLISNTNANPARKVPCEAEQAHCEGVCMSEGAALGKQTEKAAPVLKVPMLMVV
jgi:hypothetical protein